MKGDKRFLVIFEGLCGDEIGLLGRGLACFFIFYVCGRF